MVRALAAGHARPMDVTSTPGVSEGTVSPTARGRSVRHADTARRRGRAAAVHAFDQGGSMESGSNGSVVVADGITRVYGGGDTAVQALRGVSVDIQSGKLTAVMGPSGS